MKAGHAYFFVENILAVYKLLSATVLIIDKKEIYVLFGFLIFKVDIAYLKTHVYRDTSLHRRQVSLIHEPRAWSAWYNNSTIITYNCLLPCGIGPCNSSVRQKVRDYNKSQRGEDIIRVFPLVIVIWGQWLEVGKGGSLKSHLKSYWRHIYTSSAHEMNLFRLPKIRLHKSLQLAIIQAKIQCKQPVFSKTLVFFPWCQWL